MIAIISDIHDNLVNLEKFLNYTRQNQIKELICLGDVSNDETIKNLAEGFTGTIHLVIGNMDFFDEIYVKTFANIKYYGEIGELEINTKKIKFTHLPWQAKFLARQKKSNYVFYGHTHQPSEEKIADVTLLNPGTLGGMFARATFAIWDEINDKFQLIILDTLPD